MDKKEHIDFWFHSALRDWEVVNDLVASGRYMYALFFAHLVVEKLLKAHWVKKHIENVPPRVHNLSSLYEQTDLELSEVIKDELPVISTWNIETRYQDYKDRFYQVATLQYTRKKLVIVKEIMEWLIRALQ